MGPLATRGDDAEGACGAPIRVVGGATPCATPGATPGVVPPDPLADAVWALRALARARVPVRAVAYERGLDVWRVGGLSARALLEALDEARREAAGACWVAVEYVGRGTYACPELSAIVELARGIDVVAPPGARRWSRGGGLEDEDAGAPPDALVLRAVEVNPVLRRRGAMAALVAALRAACAAARLDRGVLVPPEALEGAPPWLEALARARCDSTAQFGARRTLAFAPGRRCAAATGACGDHAP